MSNIVICGFDHKDTENIVSKLVGNNEYYSLVYVDDTVHREDKQIAHLKLPYDGICPYIDHNCADVLMAEKCEDAIRYFDWIKRNGIVRIRRVPDCREDEQYSQLDMLEYLYKQYEDGYIKLDLSFKY